MKHLLSTISATLGYSKEHFSVLRFSSSSSIVYHNSVFRWIVKTDGKRYLFPKEGYKSYYTLPLTNFQALTPHLAKAYQIAKSFAMIEKNRK